MTVKSAVNAVVFAVVGNVQWRKHINAVAEVLSGLALRSLCDLFQKWKCSRGKECGKVFRCYRICLQCPAHISSRIAVIVIVFGCFHHLIHNVRTWILHTWQVGHVVNTVFLLIFQNFFIQNTFVQMFFCCMFFHNALPPDLLV